MMGVFSVIAGDFAEKGHQLVRGQLLMKGNGLFREKIPLSQIDELAIASESSLNSVGGALGWGLAGEALLGPVGLAAGLIRGGRKHEITFVCRLRDGRRFLGFAPAKVFSVMQRAALKTSFERASRSETPQLSAKEGLLIPSQDINHPEHISRSLPLAAKKPSFYQRNRTGIIIVLGFIAWGIVRAINGSSTLAPTPTPSPLKVSIDITKSGGSRPIVDGKTNLPDGIKLIVSINRRNGSLAGQQDVVVANGQFEAGPFTNGDDPYRPGTYTAEITSSLASLQSPDVQSVIGSMGQYMQGPAIVSADIGTTDKVVDYSSTFRVP
jgi:hypothetical protein